MPASLFGEFNTQQFTDGSVVAANYRLYTYSPSTTTHKVAYTDTAASVPHTYTSDGSGGQYIALNSRGELPAPLMGTSGGYDIRLNRPDGSTVWTRRAATISDGSDTVAADLATSNDVAKGATLVGYSESTAYATANTLGKYIRDFVRQLGTRCLGLGASALNRTVTGADNIGIGTNALNAATTGFGNVAIGTDSQKLVTSCGYSTSVGAYSLATYDQPANVNALNTAIGAYTLNKAVAGAQYNTSIGAYALKELTTGYFNTALGQNALPALTTGFSNTAGGHSAGLNLAGASNYNTLFGEVCGELATLASGLTLYGYSAGRNNLTANYLHAFGYAAAAQATAGTGSAFGKQAAYSVSTNGEWAAFGYEAGLNAVGSQWTAVGYQAGGGTNPVGTGSTKVGYRSGYSEAAVYINSTAIGANTNNTSDNQVVIGDRATVTQTILAGKVTMSPPASVTPAANGDLEIQATSNTSITFKYKGSDGTVRSGSITLS